MRLRKYTKLTNYNPEEDMFYPKSICSKCRYVLLQVDKQEDKSKKEAMISKLQVVEVDPAKFPRPLRSSGQVDLAHMEECPCPICVIAVENVSSFGHKFAAAKPKPGPKPSKPPPPTPEVVPRCEKCGNVSEFYFIFFIATISYHYIPT